jgi:hypothetical protein
MIPKEWGRTTVHDFTDLKRAEKEADSHLRRLEDAGKIHKSNEL